MGERVRARMEKLGIGFNELDRAIGQNSGYATRLVSGKKKRPDPAILARIARELGVTSEWLLMGEGELPELTPPTPPIRSGTRPRVEREDIERVDGWFHEALQELGGRRYSKDQVKAARDFLTSGAPFLGEPSDPHTFVLGALEAARELDEGGQEMAIGAILKLLLTKNAPGTRGAAAAGVRAHEAAVQAGEELMASERKAMKRRGHTPPRRQ